LLLTGATAFADAGLTVSGAKLVVTTSPGNTFTHQITVSIGSAGQPADITLRVSPMAQSLDGPPLPSQDAGPYSASGFISLDKDSFHLDPGGSQVVKATIRIPKNVGDGGRYALITIVSRPSAGDNLNILTAVDVPIYITVKKSHLTHEGTIISLSANVPSNQAIDVTTIFENTGNHDFKVKNTVTVSDSQGQTMASADTGLSLWTLIPGMSREMTTTLFPEIEMPPGSYRITSQATLDDGTILAQSAADINLATTLSAVAPVVPTQTTQAASAPSNKALVVFRAGMMNWVLVIASVAGLVIVSVLARRVFMNR
jgi:hypothetical protein